MKSEALNPNDETNSNDQLINCETTFDSRSSNVEIVSDLELRI